MLNSPQSDFFTVENRNTLLLVETPLDVDPDIVWDAVVSFTEELCQVDHASETYLSWKEVRAEAFAETWSQGVAQGATDSFVRATWAPGRLAVEVRAVTVSDADWDNLRQGLYQAYADVAPDATPEGWRFSTVPAQQVDVAYEDIWIKRADLAQPVRATPEQDAILALLAGREDGVHPYIALEPIPFERLDQDALTAALEALQERHDILHMAVAEAQDGLYLQLNDGQDLPLSFLRSFNPFLDLARLIEAHTKALARVLSPAGPLWQARLVQKSGRAVLIVVLSRVIADRITAIRLRADILKFYEAFRDGLNPELMYDPPHRQFTDYAAAARPLDKATRWWDMHIPLERTEDISLDLPFTAPVFEWTDLLAVTDNELRSAQLKFRILQAFAATLAELEGRSPDWITVPFYDMRTRHAPDLMGPFTRPCPIWIGDLHDQLTSHAVFHRIKDIARNAPLTLPELRHHFPARVPERVPYWFDFSEQTAEFGHGAREHDVSLEVTLDKGKLAAHWAVRRDHPLSEKHVNLRKAFKGHLKHILKPETS